MAIEIITYPGVVREAVYDAMAFDSLVGASGFFYGGALSKVNANTLRISAGFGCVKGRMFAVTQTDLTVASTSADKYGKVWIELNLSGGTPLEIKVSSEYSSSPENIIMNENEDINFVGGSAHQMEVGYFSVSASGIGDITQIRGGDILLNKTKYDTMASEVEDVKKEIADTAAAEKMYCVDFSASGSVSNRGKNYVLYNRYVAHFHISMYASSEIAVNTRICWSPIATKGISNVYCGVGGAVLQLSNSKGLVPVGSAIPANTVFTADFTVPIDGDSFEQNVNYDSGWSGVS